MGRGRAARTLVPHLVDAGHEIAWQRDETDAHEPGLGPVDVVLLMVTDSAIEAAARGLADRPSAADEIWLHLSGSRPGSVCRVSEAVPAAAGCLHPLQALPGTEVPRSHLEGATAGIDGDPEACAAAERLARELGMVPRRLAPSDKVRYHAAAVHVAGHATALVAQAMRILGACGFDPDQARGALLPLVEGAIGNLREGAPEDVITGPAARGDEITIARHLAALDALDPHVAATYRLLAQSALDLSRQSLGPESAGRLRALLAD